MNSLDVLHYSLAIGFLILTAFFAFAAYRLARVLKKVESVIDDIEDATRDVKILKDSVKAGIAGLTGIFLRKVVRKNSKRE